MICWDAPANDGYIEATLSEVSDLKRIISVFLLLCVCLAKESVAFDGARAIKNYNAVISGKKKIESLSAEEAQEVYLIYRQVRISADGSGSDCDDARSNIRQLANELSDTSKKLMRCAESASLGDDCNREFRRTRDAYDAYASALSNVSSRCR